MFWSQLEALSGRKQTNKNNYQAAGPYPWIDNFRLHAVSEGRKNA